MISRNWVNTSAFLLALGDLLRQFAQAGELAAALRRVAAVAQPLRGMIADLLEPHDERQHEALPLDAVRVVQRLGQFGDRLLVERRLRFGQRTPGAHLGLVGQVGNDALVRLQPPQDVGPREGAQRAVIRLARVPAPTDEPGERARRAEQARVEEVEDGPQVARPVLDWRAGEREACGGLQFLHGPGLAGAGILDRLGLIQDHQVPGPLPQALPAASASHRS